MVLSPTRPFVRPKVSHRAKIHEHCSVKQEETFGRSSGTVRRPFHNGGISVGRIGHIWTLLARPLTAVSQSWTLVTPSGPQMSAFVRAPRDFSNCWRVLAAIGGFFRDVNLPPRGDQIALAVANPAVARRRVIENRV